MFEHVLRANPDVELRVLIVWSPIMSTDGREAAIDLAAELDDPRAQFFWDEQRAVGKALRPELEIGAAAYAWDVYCFFDAGARWGETAPAVARWAHQLDGADKSHYFGDRLGETLQAWTKEMAGGEASEVGPAPQPTDVFTIRAEEIRPITEILLDKILDDLAQEGDATIDPEALARIAVALRRRMAEATRPHVEKIPKAIRHEDGVLIVSPPDCAPLKKSRGDGAKEK